MPEQFSIRVDDDRAGVRLDVFLASEFPSVSRTRIQKMITAGDIRLNSQKVQPRRLVDAGDVVSGELIDRATWSAAPEDVPFDVVYEDEWLAVINKPRGLAVHPGAGRPSGTLVNGLAARYGQLPEGSAPERPGIVHRLDKDTSGLLLVALRAATMQVLSEMIAERRVTRHYQALVWGDPRFTEAVVNAAVGRDPKHPERMAVLSASDTHPARPAETSLHVRERYGDAALLDAALRTGRTHQIRVHCAYAGHHLVGDHTYGSRRGLPAGYSREQTELFRQLLIELDGQALHAGFIELQHPHEQKRLSLVCDPPDVMQRLITFFRDTAGGRAE